MTDEEQRKADEATVRERLAAIEADPRSKDWPAVAIAAAACAPITARVIALHHSRTKETKR